MWLQLRLEMKLDFGMFGERFIHSFMAVVCYYFLCWLLLRLFVSFLSFGFVPRRLLLIVGDVCRGEQPN